MTLQYSVAERCQDTKIFQDKRAADGEVGHCGSIWEHEWVRERGNKTECKSVGEQASKWIANQVNQ